MEYWHCLTRVPTKSQKFPLNFFHCCPDIIKGYSPLSWNMERPRFQIGFTQNENGCTRGILRRRININLPTHTTRNLKFNLFNSLTIRLVEFKWRYHKAVPTSSNSSVIFLMIAACSMLAAIACVILPLHPEALMKNCMRARRAESLLTLYASIQSSTTVYNRRSNEWDYW